MNRKRLYAGLAVLFLFALVFLLAKQFLFQEEPISSRSGREIYETLMSLRPGTSIEKAQEILGEPNDVADNVSNLLCQVARVCSLKILSKGSKYVKMVV